jgi:diaminopimelate epimerase
MRVEFTKMYAAGNDFMVLDGPVPDFFLRSDKLRALGERCTGIGFDQMLLIEPPRDSLTCGFYRVFNADGREVEQCGNGARCVAALLQRRGLAQNGVLALGSPAGQIQARITGDGVVSVDLGVPDFHPRALPFDAPAEADNYALKVAEQRLRIGVVSLGNPHAVLTVASVDIAPVETLGAAIESHPRFPKRVNVGFLEIVDRTKVRLRVYERGAGETGSCGTGACAAVAVARRRGLLDANVHVETRGGELQVTWPGAGEHIWLAGRAHVSFQGSVEIKP